MEWYVGGFLACMSWLVGQDVAVKEVHPHHMRRKHILQRHIEEAAVLYQLRDAQHIVKLLGWCNTTLVVEYYPQNLAEVLMDPSTPEWTTRQALDLCLDAAKGVAELHAVHGAHMDLQPRQFLISSDKSKLYLNDFNRMRYAGHNLTAPSKPCTFEIAIAKGLYRAPEEYMRLPLTEKADIFSLALVFWSIQARDRPYEGMHRDRVYEQVPMGLRPSKEPLMNYPVAMRKLIKQMWATDPEMRPSADVVVKTIEDILQSIVDGTARDM